jgi:hypothetical protein
VSICASECRLGSKAVLTSKRKIFARFVSSSGPDWFVNGPDSVRGLAKRPIWHLTAASLEGGPYGR